MIFFFLIKIVIVVKSIRSYPTHGISVYSTFVFLQSKKKKNLFLFGIIYHSSNTIRPSKNIKTLRYLIEYKIINIPT